MCAVRQKIKEQKIKNPHTPQSTRVYVLASTYFSGQLPAEYLQRKRA